MKKDILKKIIACGCVIGLIMAGSGCKKDKEQTDAEVNTTSQTEQTETVEDGIEDGGEIDDEGNIVESSKNALENADKQPENKPEQQAEKEEIEIKEGENKPAENVVVQPEVKLEYGDDGNITKDCAVALLQKYTAEQLGLTPNVSHQLLFDANGATVDGKACYAIAAKIPGKETEGVFYVALDGSNVYRYDLENQLYITMP